MINLICIHSGTKDLALLRWDFDWKGFPSKTQASGDWGVFSNFHKCFFFNFVKLSQMLPQDPAQQQLGRDFLWVDCNRVRAHQHGAQLTHFNRGESFLFLGEFFLVLSGLFIHTFLILFAGGRELLNCFQSWGFWTDQQQQVNISKQPRSPCLLFFITFLRQSSFVAPDRGIVWLSPYNSDWKPTFDIEPLLPIQADAPTRPDNWRVRLVQLSKNQFHLVYHLSRCKIIINFIPRYEGSGSGEIGMTLEGASILDRSVQAMI